MFILDPYITMPFQTSFDLRRFINFALHKETSQFTPFPSTLHFGPYSITATKCRFLGTRNTPRTSTIMEILGLDWRKAGESGGGSCPQCIYNKPPSHLTGRKLVREGGDAT